VRIVWYHNSITIQLEFTPEIQETLNYERYHHPLPLVQRRMEVLWLKSHHLPPAPMAQLAHVSENTMREYFQLYAEGGVEKLQEVHCYRPESELRAHRASLEHYFRTHPPASIKEAQSEIEALTGIKRSETQVREYLRTPAQTGGAQLGAAHDPFPGQCPLPEMCFGIGDRSPLAN
jgi:hypothetical protein